MADKSNIKNNEIPLDHCQRRRLPPLLRQAWYNLNQTFRRKISHLGITPDQFTVMRWLLEKEETQLTQRELTQLMSSDPNTITSILKRMEVAGFISRNCHPTDKRAKCIQLTDLGKKIYSKGRVIAVELQCEVLAAIPEEGREEFLLNLERLAELISKID